MCISRPIQFPKPTQKSYVLKKRDWGQQPNIEMSFGSKERRNPSCWQSVYLCLLKVTTKLRSCLCLKKAWLGGIPTPDANPEPFFTATRCSAIATVQVLSARGVPELPRGTWVSGVLLIFTRGHRVA